MNRHKLAVLSLIALVSTISAVTLLPERCLPIGRPDGALYVRRKT